MWKNIQTKGSLYDITKRTSDNIKDKIENIVEKS